MARTQSDRDDDLAIGRELERNAEIDRLRGILGVIKREVGTVRLDDAGVRRRIRVMLEGERLP